MFRTARLTGRDAAEVRWGYLVACHVTNWSLSTSADGSVSFTGSVNEADDFRLTQQGLTVCVLRPNGRVWSYPVLTLSIAGDTVHAAVRPQE